MLANTSDVAGYRRASRVVVSTGGEEKIRLKQEGPESQCGRVVVKTNLPGVFLFTAKETTMQGEVLEDNSARLFQRPIHPAEVDMELYIANRDDYLYHDLAAQAEREFDALLLQECERRQQDARRRHILERGYQPFVLQDGVFSTRSGEINYRYACRPRFVHPVSATWCYNKLPVVLRPTAALQGQALNFTASPTYFMDPDSRLLTPIASEVPCTFLFPARYRTHQGWISAAPTIHPAPAPEPLPTQPAHRVHDVFSDRDYTKGGFYESTTLSALQDFLVAPMLRDAVTYKLADQVLNVRPDNRRALSPTDVFPAGVVDPTDWRRLIFGGWWHWMEQWGQLVSVVLGLYYAYVICRSAFTALFSCRVLYQEHGFSPSLLWGLGLGRKLFPIRFYHRWRKFQANVGRQDMETLSLRRTRPRPPPRPAPRPHDYLVVKADPDHPVAVQEHLVPQQKTSMYPHLKEDGAEHYFLVSPGSALANPVASTAGPVASLTTPEAIPPSTTVPLASVTVPSLTQVCPPVVTDYTVTQGPLGDALQAGTIRRN